MYFFGTYVEKDQAKAMELMRRASRRNHPKALYFLAAATFNRVPEAPEIEEAIRFAESAEKMGLPEAASLREKLERRRDQTPEETEQVARARSG
jgi:TPR repeat protein